MHLLTQIPFAGLRELFEETEIKCSVDDMQLLGMWESNFPIALSIGMLKRHHVVCYFVADVEDEMANKFALQSSETQAGVWLSQDDLKVILRYITNMMYVMSGKFELQRNICTHNVIVASLFLPLMATNTYLNLMLH